MYSVWSALLSGLPAIGVNRKGLQISSRDFSAESVFGGHNSKNHGIDDFPMRSSSLDSSSTVGSHYGESWKEELFTLLEKDQKDQSNQLHESKKQK